MIAITAAITSIDGFAAVVEETGVPFSAPTVSEPSRANHVWEILRAGFDVGSKTNVWPKAIKDLYVLRSEKTSGGLLHPKTVFDSAGTHQHPLLPGVSPARALYTVETAEHVIALMREIYGTCGKNVRPDFEPLRGRARPFRDHDQVPHKCHTATKMADRRRTNTDAPRRDRRPANRLVDRKTAWLSGGGGI